MNGRKITAGIIAAGTFAISATDAAVLDEQPIAKQDIAVAAETVTLEQKGNIVEAKMPWKGEEGLTIKYDMGEPTLAEGFADKRSKQIVTEKVDFQDGEGFKIDIVLHEKPDTNVFCYYIEGWEDYDFFYQPPLTEEEIAEGVVRPDEIVGSYALYHKTLKHHIVGQTNYATGKFGHIPFPYVWEIGKEADKVRADNLTFDSGDLCVTAPQSFLDKANYENGVRIDPTFGYTTQGGSQANIGANIYGLSNESSGSDAAGATVTLITFYGNPPNSIQIGAAIYLNADSTKICEDAGNLVLGGSSPTQWYDINFNCVINASTAYRLLIWPSSSSTFFNFDLTSNRGNNISSGVTFETWPDPGSFTLTNNRFSIYATYTTAGGAPAPATRQSEYFFD